MQILAVILLVTIFFIAVGFGAGGYFLWRNAVPMVGLPKSALNQVIAALELTDRSVVFDLGCGDGRVLQAVRVANPGVRCIGVENNPMVWVLAKLRLGMGTKVIRGNLINQNLSAATHVFIYLGSDLMIPLEAKFERELAPGSRVVAVQFPLPKYKPSRAIKLADSVPYACELFVYDF